MRFPAAAPIYPQAARQDAAGSPKPSSLRAAWRQPANFGVVADKQCTCPASKPMWERYPPTPPFHCGENEIQASFISLASVGATPTPATISGRCSDHPAVNRASLNLSEATAGALPALPTIFGPVAQSAEQPVVCGKVEGTSPFGSAISQRVA